MAQLPLRLGQASVPLRLQDRREARAAETPAGLGTASCIRRLRPACPAFLSLNTSRNHTGESALALGLIFLPVWCRRVEQWRL